MTCLRGGGVQSVHDQAVKLSSPLPLPLLQLPGEMRWPDAAICAAKVHWLAADMSAKLDEFRKLWHQTKNWDSCPHKSALTGGLTGLCSKTPTVSEGIAHKCPNYQYWPLPNFAYMSDWVTATSRCLPMCTLQLYCPTVPKIVSNLTS